MDVRWDEGFEIRTTMLPGQMTLAANRAGLLSLARILTDLAQGQAGDHVHLDEHSSLEDGSTELVIERID